MTGNRLYGPLSDVAGDAGYADHPERVGFFTDTSVCIGCKACEVACKEWNGLPDPAPGDLTLTGMSYDNTAALGANSWRHVAFIEQEVPGDAGTARWLMASDVCKHCTHAACLDVCPTGALTRTEFGTVIVQHDVCNGCAYCVSACPFGVIDRREDDGRAWKCTMCYDRLRGGLEPACAKACPTDSIQFGPLDELRATAQGRLEQLHAAGTTEARLYGADPEDGIGGAGAFFLLLDEPEVYGLPPDPVVTTRDLPAMWRRAGVAAGLIVAGAALALGRAAGLAPVTEERQVPEAEFRSYYGRPILKMPRWKEPHLPAYLYLGGLSGASAVMGAVAVATGRRALARAGRLTATAAAAGGTVFLVAELGRPERFLNMLRVAKPTSPMSMGAWLLAAHASLSGASAASDLAGVLPRLGALAGAGAALTGPVLATYTGVLLADTAVPAWHEAQRELPFLFAGSAMASAGAVGLAVGALAPAAVMPPADRAAAARLAILGAALEMAATARLEHGSAGPDRSGPRLALETYHQGGAGEMMRAARWLVPSGAIAALAARRSRAAALAAASLLTAGAITTRFGVFRAGPASVADPKYVVAAQREPRASPS